MTNTYYKDFFFLPNITSEIKFLGVGEYNDIEVDLDTRNLLNELFKFLYSYPFIISSFFKYLMDSNFFEFYDIHLYKLGLSFTSDEINLFDDESEIDELEIDLFPEPEFIEIKLDEASSDSPESSESSDSPNSSDSSKSPESSDSSKSLDSPNKLTKLI